MNFNKLIVWIALIVLCASSAYAQQGGQPSGDSSSVEKDVLDPTASLMSFGFREIVTTNYYGRRGSANQFQFQPAIPFKAWGTSNIIRLSLPYNTGGVPGRGLADVTIFNVTVFPVSGGRFAIGPVINFASNAAGKKGDRVQAGPAVGYVAGKGKWTLGVFNQNLLGSSTRISAIQPIVGYNLPNGWALATGDAQWTVDWKRGEFVNIPAGIQVGKIVKIGSQLTRFTLNPEYNVRSLPGTPHWTIRFNFIVLVPAK